MSYNVAYIIDMEGRQFNNILPEGELGSEDDYRECYENDVALEFHLANLTPLVSSDISGEMTIVWFPYPYSVFLRHDMEKIEEIKSLESNLISIIGDARTYRLDDFLLEKWESDKDEYWFRKAGAFENFESWLCSQDSRHWKLIN